MSRKPIIVIGGGAAGLLAAGRAGELGAKVILLEKNDRLGRKILISGGGRCNVTHTGSTQDLIKHYPGNGQFLYSAFSKFSNQDLMLLLERMGISLMIEKEGKVFPSSGKASDIVRGLIRYLELGGVEVRLGEKVTGIFTEGGEVRGVKTEKENIASCQVIVATGGKSYPATGSTGDGYQWALTCGHSIVSVRPALVPLNVKEEWVRNVQGLALREIEAVLMKDEKILGRERGEMLFTHFGVSGPVILSLSRYAIGDAVGPGLTLSLNLKPALNREELAGELQHELQKHHKKQLKNALDDLLPRRLIPILIAMSQILPDKFANQVTKKERQALLDTMRNLKLTITGPRSLEEAMVTAGGVSLKEINPKTMESKLVKGLYFAGEVLDIDGFTGGYNLQAAFSTGYTAGDHAGKEYLGVGFEK